VAFKKTTHVTTFFLFFFCIYKMESPQWHEH